jgi:hypothetical protein
LDKSEVQEGAMDANIQAAASSLERAAYNMQIRINEIHNQESRQKDELKRQESHLSNDLHQAEISLAQALNNKDDNRATQEKLKLTRQIYDIKKLRDKLKQQEADQINDEEREVRSLQAQSDRLKQIAHTLEQWSS